MNEINSNYVEIQSWSHLQEQLFENSWDKGIGRFRSQCAYRGVDVANYPLSTTLMRLGGDFKSLEQHLLRNFTKYAYRDVVEKDSIWHWLTVAQHHGLPTRLLDWTNSPLVAVHFATADLSQFDKDGAIWMVQYQEAHQELPQNLISILKQDGANLFTVKMLREAIPSLDTLEGLSEKPFPLFLEPPSIDDRIVNQHSIFSLFSSAGIEFDRWLAPRPELWKKLIIPSHLKWEFRDKLDQSNITERVLFPGLDGLSQWLKRYYSPNHSR